MDDRATLAIARGADEQSMRGGNHQWMTGPRSLSLAALTNNQCEVEIING